MARKRIALSVPPKMDDILERLSDLTNQPKSKLIIEMLERICTNFRTDFKRFRADQGKQRKCA